MDIIEELDDPIVPISGACRALDVSRATLYRRTSPPPPPSGKRRRPNHRRLTTPEREKVSEVLHSDEFADQPPREVYAQLLSRGVYLASIRTMYRILADDGETRERRAQRAPKSYAVPRLTATAPNQVWTWDITKLATTTKGSVLSLYVILDLFSRYVVGWMVATVESKELASQLFKEAVERHNVQPGQVTVHADRGSPMRSGTLAELFGALGIRRSFSRPRVSNDNAYSESHFKTLKYQPDYPGRFDSLLHARKWLNEFFSWHNDAHHHEGLALYTPADVFNERVEVIAAQRQQALDKAYAAHTTRFVNGPPIAKRPPQVVAINPLTSNALELEDASSAGDIEMSIAPASAPLPSNRSPRCEPQTTPIYAS